ncbi:MAG TPA: hypothetical protein VHO91_21110 [Rhodopila sp.]|nr:hypothetical protein [Rhodopila sp.]
MACSGIHALDPVCQAKNVAGHLADDAFSKIASYFGQAATSAVDWLWRQLTYATSLDLTGPTIRTDLLITGGIATVLCVGLFVIQMITAALRREPAALARGLRGLLVATVGSAFAIGTTNLLLAAVDQLSEGVVQAATGTGIEGLGRRMGLAAGLSSAANPAILLLFSIALLIATVIVWAALMTRKMLIIISAVMAPIAFSGGVADISCGWVRRWIEFTAALIASKLILVLIFLIGIGVVQGAGSHGTGVTQTGTQLVGGVLILLLGGMAPLIAIKMVHFVGNSMQAVHVQSHATHAGVHTVAALPQKAARMSTAAGGMVGQLRARSPIGTRPPTPPPTPSRPSGTTHPAGTESQRNSGMTPDQPREGAPA